MTTFPDTEKARRLWGGWRGVVLILLILLTAAGLLAGIYLYPYWSRNYGKGIPFNEAMFGATLQQPIAFSHRLHVTDKQIDCFYCHPNGERSNHPGIPAVQKCLGCHNHIIPQHEEILKLKAYEASGQPLPWVRMYYLPNHVYFPHFRHLKKGVTCQECHGEVETVDQLHQVTFYMGFCLQCHKQRKAPLNCEGCHQ
jgi:hypothetical protein